VKRNIATPAPCRSSIGCERGAGSGPPDLESVGSLEPKLLTTITSQRWMFPNVDNALPRPEVVQPIADGRGVTEYAYVRGALRIYVSETGGIVAITVDDGGPHLPRVPDFPAPPSTEYRAPDHKDWRTAPIHCP